jgi:Ca2+/Na+ antiporter
MVRVRPCQDDGLAFHAKASVLRESYPAFDRGFGVDAATNAADPLGWPQLLEAGQMAFVIMLVSAAAIIGLVRFGLIAGLDHLAGALRWNPKLRGQVTGYATSAPELVTLVAAGLAGVWDAGLWNIAASNLINTALLASAVLFYGQLRDFATLRFLDELGFAALAVAAPLLLMQLELDTSWAVVPVLFVLFAIYQMVDRRVNPKVGALATDTVGNLPLGAILVLTTLLLIAVAGFFLGGATEEVVNELGIHPAIAGWILGVVTSLPEMVTFFAIYSQARKQGTSHLGEDTQEALDNLAASNMANTGLIYPLGLTVFLLVRGLAT